MTSAQYALASTHSVWKSQKKVSFNIASEASYLNIWLNKCLIKMLKIQAFYLIKTIKIVDFYEKLMKTTATGIFSFKVICSKSDKNYELLI